MTKQYVITLQQPNGVTVEQMQKYLNDCLHIGAITFPEIIRQMSDSVQAATVEEMP